MRARVRALIAKIAKMPPASRMRIPAHILQDRRYFHASRNRTVRQLGASA